MDPLSDFLNMEEKDDETFKTYIGSGLNCLHGASYQLKLLMLFLLRAIHKGYNFYLATEIEAADKFDDVVFQYRENGEKVHIFVQAKHKQDEQKRIKVEDLINKRGNVEYYLPKYFISYLKIKHNSAFAGSILRNYILCTNLELDLDPRTAGDEVKRLEVQSSASNQINEMFVVTVDDNSDFFINGGTRYRICYDNNNIISSMKSLFLKALLENIIELRKEKEKLQGRPEQHLIERLDHLQELLREFQQIITSNNIEVEIKDFFDSLVLAVGQPNETKLTHIMKSELSQEFNTFNSNYVYARFQEVMLDWLKDRRGYFLTQKDGFKLFEKLRVEIHGHFLFNVQSPVESFFGRAEELKTLHNLINQGGSTVICQQTSITGLGGIGKTELVRKYISEYGKEHYDDNVLWIEAESYESMKASFIDLARDILGLLCKDLDIKSVLRETYNFFAKRRCLFVFDNADAFRSDDCNAGIRDFLPSSVLPRGTNTPKVLITSRNNSWGNLPQLELKTFKQQEALDFIKTELRIENESQDADIRNLAEMLQFFPLALQQAVAYVKEKCEALTNVGSDFKITDYINRFTTQTKNLLDFNFPKDSQDLYTKTTYTIMKLTIFRIKENKEYGEQAGHILDIIAFLSPDNIPVEMFLKLDLIQNNKEKLGGAIKILKQYSLINSGQVITQLNIHRLVQQVSRIILKSQKKEKHTFENLIDILIQMFKKAINLNNYVFMRQLLNHSESFLSHLDSWLESQPKNKPIADSYFLELYPFLSRGYHDLSNVTHNKLIQERALVLLQKRFGNNNIIIADTLINLSNICILQGHPKKQKQFLERALIIQEKHFGNNHFIVAKTYGNLGTAYGALGHPQKQKEILERALVSLEKHYGNNHFEIANALVNLGTACGALGHYKKQKELLERALLIEEKHYGNNHFEVANTLNNLGTVYGALGHPQTQKEFFERALGILEKHYGNNHFNISFLLVNLGDLHGDLGEPQKQKVLLEKALGIQETHYGNNHFEVAKTLVSLGNAYGALGHPQKQKELSERALGIQEQHYGNNHYKVAETLVDLGTAYHCLGYPQKQKELLQRALGVLEKHYGNNDFRIAVILANLGHAYCKLGDPQKQIVLLERALGIQKQHYGDNHFEVAKTLVNLGCAYNVLGHPQKQKELLERALGIFEKHYGNNNFNVAAILVNLSIAYGDLGDPQKQQELLEKALGIQEKHYGDNHFEVALTLVNLGNAYSALGHPQKQKELLERALGIQKQHYGDNHFEVAKTLVNLGTAYGALGHLQKQKELLERAVAILEKHYGVNHFEVARTLVDLGTAYGALGHLQKQKELLERALAILEKHYGVNHFEVAKALVNLGTTYGALGHLQKQKELLERALATLEKHYGVNHFEVAKTLVNLGIAYGALGHLQKQKEIIERALATQEKHYGVNHFEVSKTLVNLGKTYGYLGDLWIQKDLLERALGILEKHYGNYYFEIAKILVLLGNTYGALGDPKKQKEYLEKALEIQIVIDSNNVDVAVTLACTGIAYGALGDLEKRKEYLKRALIIKEKHYDNSHSKIEE